MIARGFFLLVRGVVLFVHDDEAGRGERREDRRTRADDDVDVAAADAMPLVVPFAVGEAAVLNRDAAPRSARGMRPRPRA